MAGPRGRRSKLIKTSARVFPLFPPLQRAQLATVIMASGFSVLRLAISRRLTVSHRAATLFRSSLASVVLLELYERLEINHWL